jgi:hypothetical protein
MNLVELIKVKIQNKLTLALLMAGSFGVATGQQAMSISGKVIDEKTSQPLSYSSVKIKNTSFGTIANADGEFTIHIPPKHVHDTLQVSMLGYDSWQMRLSETSNPEVGVKLKMSSINLPEIVIRDLPAKEILKLAHDHLGENYTSKPYQIEGFYRETQKADNRYVSLMEAATLIYSTGFESREKEKYILRQLRKSIGYENPYVPFWDNRNLLIAFMSQNFVKYRGKNLARYKDVYRRDDTSIDGILVYVIDVRDRSDFWPSTLYIRCDNFAIIRTEENYNSEVSEPKKWKVESNPLITAYPKQKSLQINFKLYNGKYYPENYQMFFHAIYNDSMTGKDVLDFEIRQQFVVTEILTDSITAIPVDSVLKEDVSLKKVSANYQPDFWKNYTIIRESPLDSAIRADLERQMNLEKQFGQH